MDGSIRAMVFDFGGVFTHNEVSEAQLRAYDAILGLAPGTLHLQLHSGEAWEKASTGRISPEDYWARVGEPYQALLPPEFRVFSQGMFRAEPINEAMVALARRLYRHYTLALCSNALPDLIEVLEGRPDVRGLFDVTVVSALVGLRKPDPAIFHLTADLLQLPLQACLLVDDKVRNTAAANQIGMPSILFTSVEHLTAELQARGLLPEQERQVF